MIYRVEVYISYRPCQKLGYPQECHDLQILSQVACWYEWLFRHYFFGVVLRFRSNLLYQKFVKIPNRTRGARGGLKLNPTLGFRPATASRTRRTPKKNAPCISDLRAGEFFLKKERAFFLRCSALQVFGQVAGLRKFFCQNKLRQLAQQRS